MQNTGSVWSGQITADVYWAALEMWLFLREKEEDKEMAEFLRLKLRPLEQKLKATASESELQNSPSETETSRTCAFFFFF